MAENKTEIRVDHPGAFEAPTDQVPEKYTHSVTVAGSHTTYFTRKPTENQVEAAKEVAEVVSTDAPQQ